MLLFCLLTFSNFEIILGLLNLDVMLDNSFFDQVCYNSFIHFEATSRSLVECASLCALTEGCKSLILHSSSRTCYGLNTYFACVGQTTPLPGAQFYRQTAGPGCSESDYLVSGTNGVADSQITASSHWTSYVPTAASLDNGWHWGSGSTDTSQYLQIDFNTTRTITGIMTRGSCCGHSQWVKSYRVITSIDCISFSTIKDTNGQDKVFSGNTDDTNSVTRTLTNPVVARCVRLNPLSWKGWASLKLEILGCITT